MRQIALFSVTNKDGIGTLARALLDHGFEIVATGNTLLALQGEGISVTNISDLTEEPERFEGRLKTLHHKVLGGILFRPGQDEKEWPYDFRIAAVVCNFYPFSEKAAQCKSISEMMQWVDIGGPTMVRAAAKSFENVWVFTKPSQYARFIASPRDEWLSLRERLALDAFEEVARLDAAIEDHFLRRTLGVRSGDLRYGENPHQKASFTPNRRLGLRFHGDLSYNNLRDAEAAFRFVSAFDQGPAVAVVKHQTLCGAAAGLKDSAAMPVFEAAWEGDPVSRFGGVLAFNFLPTPAMTEILEKKFLEVLVVPSTAESHAWAEALWQRKPKLKIMQVDFVQARAQQPILESYRGIFGKLVQEGDAIRVENSGINPNQLLYAFGQWTAACSKSNAMVLAGLDDKSGVAFLAGSGQGQPNRVDSLKLLALPRAQDFATRRAFKMSDFTCFSDGFLPFTDTIDVLEAAGVKRLVQPGGSKADPDVVTRAKELQVEMTLTGERHFWH